MVFGKVILLSSPFSERSVLFLVEPCCLVSWFFWQQPCCGQGGKQAQVAFRALNLGTVGTVQRPRL